MAAIPDHFDLGVRRARQVRDESRQVDALLGLLFAAEEWYFWNVGTPEKPFPAMSEIDGKPVLLLFSSLEKLVDVVETATKTSMETLPHFAIPVNSGGAFCSQFRASSCETLLVNPGEYAFAVSLDALKAFDATWRGRKATSRGFWIPNMTSEEEDFWRELGM